MTHESELSYTLEVKINNIPAPIIHKIVSEAFGLYNEKYEDSMTEIEGEEFMEVFHAFIAPLVNIDYSIELGDFIELPEE
jgi:hypothetical protein